MSADDDIRTVLRAEADRYDPADDGWTGITAGVRSARRRRRLQGGAIGGVASACVAVGVALAVGGGGGGTDVDAGRDPRPVATAPEELGPAPSTPAPVPPTTASSTTSTTTAPPVSEAVFPGIWPFANQAAVDRYEDGDARFEDAVATADAFARDYLGMLDPVVGEAVPVADRALEVQVRLRPRGEDGQPVPDTGPTTLVRLRSYETSYGDDVWTVVGAASPNIVVEQPAGAEPVSAPLSVRGEATGYEGTVIVNVRQDGMRAGESLGEAVAIAGTYGELASFALDVAYTRPSESTGALVVTTDTGLDGVGVPEATVVPLAFADVGAPPAIDPPEPGSGPCAPIGLPGAPAADEIDVTIHLTCDGAFIDDPTADAAFVPAFRRVPRSAGVLRATLEQLVAGPTEAELTAGQSSFFSAATADLLADVTIDDRGTAIVDLRATVNNASTSAGQLAFRGALNRTVLQFSTVERVEYRIGGSCDAFWQWQQVGDCRLVTRDDL